MLFRCVSPWSAALVIFIDVDSVSMAYGYFVAVDVLHSFMSCGACRGLSVWDNSLLYHVSLNADLVTI